MGNDRIKEIKDAYKGMIDNSVTLWNARLDSLGDDQDALAELLGDSTQGGRGGKGREATNSGCSTNTVAGCGPTNTVAGCGTINTIAGCGPVKG